MAIVPETQYPGKITPANTAYPLGSARNITVPGDGTGTPWEQALVNDLFGFQQALLARAGITASGAPDSVTESQYLLSLQALFAALPGDTTVAGTATFTNSTNNIALTGIGSIGLEIGDVVQVTGTASNNKLFTVEVITDSGNVIVNQAHAGGTTTKSLVDETVSATLVLLAKFYNAAKGLGQGAVDVTSSRAKGVNYTNNTNRALSVSIWATNTSGGGNWRAVIDVPSVPMASSAGVDNGLTVTQPLGSLFAEIPIGSAYILSIAGGGAVNANIGFWTEIR